MPNDSINLFDAEYYRSANSGLNDLSDGELYSHFQDYGLDNGLEFSPLVDLDYYRASNSDLAELNNREAYEHLANYGVSEGREFSTFVDLEFYRETNSDLATLDNEELFEHLQDYGIEEGRSFSPVFDVGYYLNNNPELQELGFTYGDAYDHFVMEGSHDGLDASPYIESDYAGNTLDSSRTIAFDSGEIIFRDSIGNSDSDDFYSLTLDNDNSNLEIEISGLSADADLELLNSSGEIITRASNSANFNESLSSTNLEDGTYYIRVYQGIEQSDTNYNLRLSVTPTEAESETIVLSESPSVSATATSSAVESESTSNSGDPFIDEVVALTNEYRAEYGLEPLTLNTELSNSAQTHSEDMAHNDFFSHEGSNGSDVSTRTESAGYESSYVGENIAAGYTTAEQVVNGWMDSPGHRENILNPNYTEIGVGYYYLENDTGEVNYNSYWTQNFGSSVYS